ncbi:MAG: SDR family NAD(P)-dependent oxidoreductase, partial [Alphaproteobacteria bacterium]|nr:SDR family NAD(P)-dependent oxidoreductase [Alphaproteobacteria bacterium]
MRFIQKVAIITAAASGIGRASAGIIAQEGGTVIAVDTDEQRLENMSSEFSGSAGQVLTYCIDATDEKVVKRTLSQIS